MDALNNTVLLRIIHRQVRTIVTQKDGRLAVNFPGAWERLERHHCPARDLDCGRRRGAER